MFGAALVLIKGSSVVVEPLNVIVEGLIAVVKGLDAVVEGLVAPEGGSMLRSKGLGVTDGPSPAIAEGSEFAIDRGFP